MNDKLQELQAKGLFRVDRKCEIRVRVEALEIGDVYTVPRDLYTNEISLRAKVYNIGTVVDRKFSTRKSSPGVLHVIRIE